jgi:WD40 repeat protein
VSFIGRSELLLGASGDKTIRLHHTTNPQTLRIFDGQSTFLHCAAATADGKVIVAGGQDGTLRLWNGDSTYLIHAFPPEGVAQRRAP